MNKPSLKSLVKFNFQKLKFLNSQQQSSSNFRNMSRCQHNQRITKFCITPNCTYHSAGGCDYCFKRYHCHLGEVKFLKEPEVTQMIKQLTVFEDKKVKVRPLKEAIYNYFNIVKGQLSTYLDSLSSDLLNKISYPYIQKEGYLAIFKKLKHKEYNKISTEEMIRMTEFKANNPHEKLQNSEILSYFQQSEDACKKVVAINNLYQNFQKEAQDSYPGQTIMSVSIYYRKIMEIYDHIENQKNNFSNKYKEILSHQDIPKLHIKSKNLEKAQEKVSLTDRPRGVQLIYDTKNKTTQNTYLKRPSSEVQSTLSQVQKENSISQKKQNRLRKVSIDSRCNDMLGHSRLKTFEEKEKEIAERKQKQEEMTNKKQKKDRVSGTSESSAENEKARQLQNLDKLSNEKSLTESDFKSDSNKQEEMVAHKLLPQGKEQRKLYEQLQTIEKKTLKIPVNVIQQNVQGQECQSPIMKLRRNQRQKPAPGPSGFQLGLFKVQPTQQVKQTPTEQTRSEPIQSPVQVQSSTSQEAIEKQNIRPQVQEGKQMNITEKQANSIFLLAESLNLSAKKAIPLLQAALKYACHNFSAAQYLSYLYLQQNKPKECLKICNEALKLISGDPNSIEISVHLFNNKAAALNSLGRFSESIPILEKCIQVKKKDIFYKNLGDAYFNLGIIEKAIINYENALILNDDNHEALYNLGVCLYLQKNYESSKLKVQRALMLDHENQNYLELYKQIGMAIQQEKIR